MKKEKVLTLIVFLLFSFSLFAKDAKAPVYVPTEVQSLQLKVAQQDAMLARDAMIQAQQTFQNKLLSLNQTAEKIKKDNGWPDDVKFDLNTLTFSAPPPEKKK